MEKIMKASLVLTVATLFLSLTACTHSAKAQETASGPRASFFRVFQGFKRADMPNERFTKEFPKFMNRTVDLYAPANILNNYIVVIPPAKKPSYIPDEFALVALTSEEGYRAIRATPEGQAYSEDHWTYFNKETSKSAPYELDAGQALVHNQAYDLSPSPVDWSKGHTLFFLGTRKAGQTPEQFLSKLRSHIDLAKHNLVPLGLKGYIVLANENYEAAYINFESKEAMDAAFAQAAGQEVGEDARLFMDVLMWEPTKKLTLPLSTGVYQAVDGF